MNPINLEENPGNQEIPNNEIFQENNQPIGPIGPLELSILERVEHGLIDSRNEPQIQETKSVEDIHHHKRYKGPKEIIFVSGWICIDSVYKRYFWNFISKIVIGIYFFHNLVQVF
jgi:hypothetical protein